MTRLLPLLLVLAGCTINDGRYPRPRDLSPGWRVDKLRLLAIQAEPPEVEPGRTATFRALLVDPDDTVDLTVWVWCTEQAATSFGCPFDPTTLDGADLDPDDLEAAGVIGVEPFLAPSFTPDATLLDGLDERERLEGVNVTINALSLPETVDDTDSFDFNEVESGFKRLVVSQATTPNRNPSLDGFTVDGARVPEQGVALVDPGQPYELAPVLGDDAIETYTFVNRDGVAEERVEEPFVTWFASGGTLDEDTTLHPFLEATWIAPVEPGVAGTVWAVVQDRRGGISWVERRWRTVE